MDQRQSSLSRRHLLTASAALAAASLLPRSAAAAELKLPDKPVVQNGRINQGVCGGVFRGLKISLDEQCQIVQKLGLKGYDLVGPSAFATLKKYNLVATMVPSHGLAKGLNRKENHDECLAKIRASIDAASEAGFPNVITFPGNRAGMSDDEGAKNMAEGLKKIAAHAEEKKVTLCIELLNSKVNHADYMADHTAWGVQVCKLVGSPRIKLLYDIYHMQIMEGDVIDTIKRNKDYIGHYHTAGVPGRHQLDETQELNYAPIMKAILATGYTGYVSHEYTPTKDAIECLIQAVKTCDI